MLRKKKTADEKLADLEKKKEKLLKEKDKETEKAQQKLKEQQDKETARAQKKALKKKSKGTGPTVSQHTKQTGQNGGKPAEESSHLTQGNFQSGTGNPEHTTPSRPQPGGNQRDGSMTKTENTPASTTDPTEDSGRHVHNHLQKGAGKPELTTLSQPQPEGSHHDGSMIGIGYTSASTTAPSEDRDCLARGNLPSSAAIPEHTTQSHPQPEGYQHDWSNTGRGYTPASITAPAEESSHLALNNVQRGAGKPESTTPSQPQPGGSQHNGSGRGNTSASTTAPAEERNRPAQNNLQKGDSNPEPATLSQPQPGGSQHDAMSGRRNTPASTTDDTSRLPEDNVQKGAGNPEDTTPSQSQPECSQHDVSMTEGGKTPCGATDDTLSCAPKELTDTNAAADDEEDKGISQGHAADEGNEPPQSNLVEDDVKEAEKDKSFKKLMEENEKLKKELKLQKQVSVAPDNSPSDNTALEVRCAVVVESDGIRQTRYAREQFLKSVKTSLSSDGINLDTTNVTPGEEMDEDKAGRFTKPLLLIVPCLATARVESNITNAIDKITIRREHKKLLVVFHPRAAHDVHVPESRHQVSPEIIRRCEIIVDVIFDRVSGAIFPIQINRDAESRMNEYLHGCASPGATD